MGTSDNRERQPAKSCARSLPSEDAGLPALLDALAQYVGDGLYDDRGRGSTRTGPTIRSSGGAARIRTATGTGAGVRRGATGAGGACSAGAQLGVVAGAPGRITQHLIRVLDDGEVRRRVEPVLVATGVRAGGVRAAGIRVQLAQPASIRTRQLGSPCDRLDAQ